jgi:hypothetical protein
MPTTGIQAMIFRGQSLKCNKKANNKTKEDIYNFNYISQGVLHSQNKDINI